VSTTHLRSTLPDATSPPWCYFFFFLLKSQSMKLGFRSQPRSADDAIFLVPSPPASSPAFPPFPRQRKFTPQALPQTLMPPGCTRETNRTPYPGAPRNSWPFPHPCANYVLCLADAAQGTPPHPLYILPPPTHFLSSISVVNIFQMLFCFLRGHPQMSFGMLLFAHSPASCVKVSVVYAVSSRPFSGIPSSTLASWGRLPRSFSRIASLWVLFHIRSRGSFPKSELSYLP